jgi:hypothetical protein
MSEKEATPKKQPAPSLSELAFKEVCRQIEQIFADEKGFASFFCGGIIPIRTGKLINIYWSGKGDSQGILGKLDLPFTNPSKKNSDNRTKTKTGEKKKKGKRGKKNNNKSNNSIHQLVAGCEPAGFGRESELVIDSEYRKAGKLESSKSSTTFHPADYGILDQVSQILVRNIDAGNAWLVPRGVEAELKKLNVSCAVLLLYLSTGDTGK